MKLLFKFPVIIGLALLSACVKHEVIPPPKYEVDLPAFFRGAINGSNFEIMKDLDGYISKATQVKKIMSTPNPSNIIYQSALQSDQKLEYIQISLGKLIFNADYSIDPKLEDFTDFFNNNITPSYSNGAENGVEIIFRDNDGRIWKSDEIVNAVLEFKFTSLSQESDENGDYLKFTARFDVILSLDVPPTDPNYGALMEINNAVFQGYFEK